MNHCEIRMSSWVNCYMYQAQWIRVYILLSMQLLLLKQHLRCLSWWKSFAGFNMTLQSNWSPIAKSLFCCSHSCPRHPSSHTLPLLFLSFKHHVSPLHFFSYTRTSCGNDDCYTQRECCCCCSCLAASRLHYMCE